MTTEFLNDYIDRATENLGISVRPEWKPNVAMFFEVARGMAKMIEATEAATSAEAAAIFSPHAPE